MDPAREVTVRTAAGRVVVQGTVFSVRTGPEACELQVLRGRVRVEAPASGQREVEAGQAALVGGREVRPLTGEERRALELRTLSLELFRSKSTRSSTLISTSPADATVSVDGCEIGRTPLSLVVGQGGHQLALEHAGYQRYEGPLEPAASGTQRLHFELRPLQAAAVPGPPAPAPRCQNRTTGTGVTPPATSATATPRLASPARLLGLAGEHRRAGDWEGVAQAYREVIEQHGGSPEAGVALVGLGSLMLDQLGRPADALAAFEQYGSSFPDGVLAQEAAYGGLQALHRLGNRAAEMTALRTFLSRYPESIQAPGLRARLEELRRGRP